MSLLAALDRTVTPMGARKLRQLDSAAAAQFALSSSIDSNDRGSAQEPELLGSLRAALKGCARLSSGRSGG
jgi:DNA mismatch repair ATPase MutS